MPKKAALTGVDYTNFLRELYNAFQLHYVTAPADFLLNEIRTIENNIQAFLNSNDVQGVRDYLTGLYTTYNLPTNPLGTLQIEETRVEEHYSGTSINTAMSTRTSALTAAFQAAAAMSGNGYPVRGGFDPVNDGVWFDFGNNIAVVEHRGVDHNNQVGLVQTDTQTQRVAGHFHIYVYDLNMPGHQYVNSQDSRPNLSKGVYPRRPVSGSGMTNGLFQGASQYRPDHPNHYGEAFKLSNVEGAGHHIFYNIDNVNDWSHLEMDRSTPWFEASGLGQFKDKISEYLKKARTPERHHKQRPDHLHIPNSQNNALNMNELMESKVWYGCGEKSSPITGRKLKNLEYEMLGAQTDGKPQYFNFGGVGVQLHPDKNKRWPTFKNGPSITGQGDHFFATLSDVAGSIRDRITTIGGNTIEYNRTALDHLSNFANGLDQVWHRSGTDTSLAKTKFDQYWRHNFDIKNYKGDHNQALKNIKDKPKMPRSKKILEKNTKVSGGCGLISLIYGTCAKNSKSVWHGQEELWGGLIEQMKVYTQSLTFPTQEQFEYLADYIDMLTFTWTDYTAVASLYDKIIGSTIIVEATEECREFLYNAMFFTIKFADLACKVTDFVKQPHLKDRIAATRSTTIPLSVILETVSIATNMGHEQLVAGAYTAWRDAYRLGVSTAENLANGWAAAYEYINTHVQSFFGDN